MLILLSWSDIIVTVYIMKNTVAEGISRKPSLLDNQKGQMEAGYVH